MTAKQTHIDFSKVAMLKGLQKAEDHANAVHNNWSDDAYKFLTLFITHKKGDFMVEDVRTASKYIVPEPPSMRAWGAIILRAAKARMIKKVGIRAVKNLKAHKANASVWRRL